MSSSESNTEKSEQQRIWELEEQLEDEQHAHRKTKFTLRDVQQKLEGLRLESNTGAGKTNHQELLLAENEDLKKRLEDLKEKMEVLEKDNRNLRYENSSLEKSNEENSEARKKMNNEMIKMKYKLKSDKEEMEEFNDLVRERDELKNEVKEVSETKMDLHNRLVDILKKYSDLEESNEKAVGAMKKLGDLRREYANVENSFHDALHSLKVLKSEKDNMEIEMAKRVYDYEMRLNEYRSEVNQLSKTKERLIKSVQWWITECKGIITRLISLLEERNSEEDAEELNKLARKKASDIHSWSSEYLKLHICMSNAFASIQNMKNDPCSREVLTSSINVIQKHKEDYDKASQFLRSRTGRKEWIESELSLKYFEELELLVAEAE